MGASPSRQHKTFLLADPPKAQFGVTNYKQNMCVIQLENDQLVEKHDTYCTIFLCQ